MMAETEAYKVLSNDKKLNDILDKARGRAFSNSFNQGIFTYDIPEKPTNLKKVELAPFIRINTTFEIPTEYADDDYLCIERRIAVEFWCRSANQAEAIGNRIDEVLEGAKFERYTASENPRYKDPDIDLLKNTRKYRLFDWVKNENEVENNG